MTDLKSTIAHERTRLGQWMTIDGPVDCYQEDIDPGGRFHDWYVKMEDEKRQCAQELADFERKYPPIRPVASDIKSTLALCLLAALLTSVAFIRLAHGADTSASKTESVILAIPAHTSDATEDPEARRKRLRVIVAAIDSATSDLTERAWLIMTARRESGLAAYVTEDHDRCRLGVGGRCDGGRAFGAWQVHGTKRDLTVAEQAVYALQRLRQSARHCSARHGTEWWTGGISAYATGYRCNWAEAGERREAMMAVRARL